MLTKQVIHFNVKKTNDFDWGDFSLVIFLSIEIHVTLNFLEISTVIWLKIFEKTAVSASFLAF